MVSYIDKRVNKIEIADGNVGYFSNSYIPKNTIILVEKPFKIYKSIDKMLDNIENDLKKYKLVNKFNMLYPRDLNNNYKDYYLEKICKNAFNFNRKTYSNPCILFNGAIFNHSCDPNVLFVNKGDSMIFYTIKDIEKGEELYDHYIDVNLPFMERKELLYKNYGFVCKCERCNIRCNKKILNYFSYHNKF